MTKTTKNKIYMKIIIVNNLSKKKDNHNKTFLIKEYH